MEKKKIRFAVWNIYGPTKRPSMTSRGTPLWEQEVRNILWDDENEKSDFVFLQEIPNPMNTKLKKQFQELNPPERWYDWHSATDDENYFRGIMLYRKTNDPEITFDPLGNPDPKHYIGQVYSIRVKGVEILRFIGFWNVRQIPGKNAKQQSPDASLSKETKDYYPLLTAFLETALPANVPCIIAGDTNVCISSSEINGKNAADCPDRKKLTDFLAQKDLVLINGETGNSPVLETMTHCFLKKKLFRCDLLMASRSLQERICDISIGKPEKYMKCRRCSNLDICALAGGDPARYGFESNSDHLPLFFSFSY